MKSYEITEPVSCEHRVEGAVIAVSFEPGVVKPKGAGEAAVLDKLVALGIATVAKPARKKTAETQGSEKE